MADRLRSGDGDNEAVRVYERLKALFGGDRPRRRTRQRPALDDAGSVPFGKGREPKGLGDVVEQLTAELGWESSLAQSELVENWGELAGEETAKHSTPVGIEGGTLTVQCASTAWATQLRLMRSEILAHIARRYPEAGIDGIRFLGPNVPSFKRGPRSVQGRGVRDTYG